MKVNKTVSMVVILSYFSSTISYATQQITADRDEIPASIKIYHNSSYQKDLTKDIKTLLSDQKDIDYLKITPSKKFSLILQNNKEIQIDKLNIQGFPWQIPIEKIEGYATQTNFKVKKLNNEEYKIDVFAPLYGGGGNQSRPRSNDYEEGNQLGKQLLELKNTGKDISAFSSLYAAGKSNDFQEGLFDGIQGKRKIQNSQEVTKITGAVGTVAVVLIGGFCMLLGSKSDKKEDKK